MRSDVDEGKRTRQAVCVMICPNPTLNELIGDPPPIPVAPHPEIRACWFSKVWVICRRFGRRTAFTFAEKVIDTTNLTKAMSLSLFDALRYKIQPDKIS